jgi:hypothetical protein
MHKVCLTIWKQICGNKVKEKRNAPAAVSITEIWEATLIW